jgi:hypothetical protein
VLSLVLPAAFFAALDHGSNVTIIGEEAVGLLTDEMRANFLRFSRGISVVLLFMSVVNHAFVTKFGSNICSEGISVLASIYTILLAMIMLCNYTLMWLPLSRNTKKNLQEKSPRSTNGSVS